jgi:hypothetical protein
VRGPKARQYFSDHFTVTHLKTLGWLGIAHAKRAILGQAHRPDGNIRLHISTMPPDALLELDPNARTRWSAVYGAIEKSETKFAELRRAVYGDPPLVSDDTPLIVYGSLAREEFQDGSDLDWTLLVDGTVDAGHARDAMRVRAKLQEHSFIPPGPTGTFGELTFAHDLVHYIGGVADTNVNTTRRVLLLLESKDVSQGLVHNRVVTAVLKRYVEQDVPLKGRRVHLPRFLLNDIVRYWRTMAVDYASKTWERDENGWAIRNVKLRLSRKLLYVKGLLVCFDYALTHLNDHDVLPVPDGTVSELTALLSGTPVQCLARFEKKWNLTSVAADALDNYNNFLALLAENGNRDSLKRLRYESASEDQVFGKFRKESQQFQACLIKLFFAQFGDLTELAQEYGLF